MSFDHEQYMSFPELITLALQRHGTRTFSQLMHHFQRLSGYGLIYPMEISLEECLINYIQMMQKDGRVIIESCAAQNGRSSLSVAIIEVLKGSGKPMKNGDVFYALKPMIAQGRVKPYKTLRNRIGNHLRYLHHHKGLKRYGERGKYAYMF